MSFNQSSAAYKFDVANLVSQRSIYFAEPPEIRHVKRWTEIVVYIIVTICAAVQMGLLHNVLKHRSDSIMKLSQVYFLVTLQVAGIIATVSTIFFNPRSDAFCRLQGPMTLIPLQLMMAIMIGRLHRVIVIMAPLLAWREEKTKNLLHLDLKRWSQTFISHINPINMLPHGVNMPNLPNLKDMPLGSHVHRAIGRSNSNVRGAVGGGEKLTKPWFEKCWGYFRRLDCPKSEGHRQEYTATQLNALICAVTIPVVVVEAIELIFFDPVLTLRMNESSSVGRFLFDLYSFSAVIFPFSLLFENRAV